MRMQAWQIRPPTDEYLMHHGREGQRWGVKNGPPYPLDESAMSLEERKAAEETIDTPMKYARMVKKDETVLNAVNSGTVSLNVHTYNQNKHIVGTKEHDANRSYIYGEVKDAQKYINDLYGTGTPIVVNGVWKHKERVASPYPIGIYKSPNGDEYETNNAMIVYGKAGSHIYPRQGGDE